jgi:hypothetical protein
MKDAHIKHKDDERLVSRSELAARWSCSRETLKRRERDGILKPIRFNSRLLRYRLSEVLVVESVGQKGGRANESE